MNATRILVAQHRAIESLFEALERETRRRARSNAVSRLAEEIIAHMAAEEAVFYPAVRRAFDAGEEASEHGRQAHLLLRIELRRLLETNLGDAGFGARVEALRCLFAQHVDDEEGELFPKVVAEVSASELETLGTEILASRPPVWIVTTEGRDLVGSGDDWAIRSRVSLPIPARE
jgi:hypothetical protein